MLPVLILFCYNVAKEYKDSGASYFNVFDSI